MLSNEHTIIHSLKFGFNFQHNMLVDITHVNKSFWGYTEFFKIMKESLKQKF